jgi:hypothetical protein
VAVLIDQHRGGKHRHPDHQVAAELVGDDQGEVEDGAHRHLGDHYRRDHGHQDDDDQLNDPYNDRHLRPASEAPSKDSASTAEPAPPSKGEPPMAAARSGS